MFLPRWWVAPSLGFFLTGAAPGVAAACGGTFCDNLPDPMAVDQRGEDILFVSDGETVEVQVRIQYEGEAERFAWLLPIQAVPEVSVGSDLLFTALSLGTAPQWSSKTDYDCPEDAPGWGDDEGGLHLDMAGGSGTGGEPPQVVFEEVVGAFEVVVLQGGTAQEVIDFLDANDYAQDPDAEPILQEYLDEGFLFAAVKLAAGAEVSEIHPLTFTFAGDEPCVPIRLTRIAAKDDMGIRAYFLGQDQWAPSNYAHVVLNPLAYPWSSSTTQAYLELLSLAVDEAGGQAFATDYAGSPEQVPEWMILNDAWDANAFVGVDPITAIELIDGQQLATHPLIRALLIEFLPPPDGVEVLEFWNNIEDYADQIDDMTWDADAFAAALAERIIEPAVHAVDLLETWPMLTRLHTTMSPVEMTVDPVFHPNPDLPAVTDGVVETREQVLCGAVDRIYHVFIDEQDYPVCVPSGSFPSLEGMPAALRIEQVPMMGPAQVTTDNQALVDSIFMAYDESVACVADGGGEDEFGDTGGPSSGDGGDGDGGGESTETGPTYDLPYDVSCGCSAPDGGGAPFGIALGLAVLALVGPWRRRSS